MENHRSSVAPVEEEQESTQANRDVLVQTETAILESLLRGLTDTEAQGREQEEAQDAPGQSKADNEFLLSALRYTIERHRVLAEELDVLRDQLERSTSRLNQLLPILSTTRSNLINAKMSKLLQQDAPARSRLSQAEMTVTRIMGLVRELLEIARGEGPSSSSEENSPLNT